MPKKNPLAGAVAATQTDSSLTDGRRLRSQDSRTRIVAAMIDLVGAGHLSVGAEQVAAKAGVGLRSVFRHFKDMDSLYGEMSRVVESQLSVHLNKPFESAEWRARLEELLERRLLVFEQIAPYRRAGLVHRHRSPSLVKENEYLQSFLRSKILSILPPDLAQEDDLVETLDFLLSFGTWNRLRVDQGLPAETVRRVISACMTATLPPA